MGRRRKTAVKAFARQNQKNFNRGGSGDQGYQLPERNNELFVKYYKGQGIVPEEEWDDFFETLKRTLPVTFRITGYKSQAEELLKNIKGKFFSNLIRETIDGEEVQPPKCLPWYPNELGWQLDLSRKIVRSSEKLSKLHNFLVAETECGSISRQEAVSMIPPLVLDIQSHHKIVDMCAAPGSKTAQLIEYLHSRCNGDDLPSGYVIANDNDNKRCYLMVHQVKRLQSPCCMIVNHDATSFPSMRCSTEDSAPEFEHYDRVLCDVPCSGDGTLRKNFDVWSKWHPLQGANMHGLQGKILKRGCQILAKGGRLVYSTCSLNPIEDEAVIAEMLRNANGSLELVDIHDQLPGLKYSKGMSTWKVMTKTGEWIESKEEIPPALQTQYKHTIFPPTPEEAETFHLDKCIRILPHQQDTGGFFVAAIQKVAHLPGSKEARSEAEAAKKIQDAKEKEMDSSEQVEPTSTETKDASDTGTSEVQEKTDEKTDTDAVGEKRKSPSNTDTPPKKKQRMFGFKEDPFFFMVETDPIWPTIKEFYGLPEDFPFNQLMYRSEQGKRTLYFVSKAIRHIVACNENRMKFINMGVKAFSRSPSPLVPSCNFRITQECLGTLLPLVQKRRINVTKDDSVIIISQENPFTYKLSQIAQSQLEEMSPGSTVFVFSPSESEPFPGCDIVFCGWRGKTSVRCFGNRCDRAHHLMLLGEDLQEMNKKVEEEKKAKQLKAEQLQQALNDDLPPLEEDGKVEDIKEDKVEVEDATKVKLEVTAGDNAESKIENGGGDGNA